MLLTVGEEPLFNQTLKIRSFKELKIIPNPYKNKNYDLYEKAFKV